MANFQVFVYPNDWTLWNDAQTVRDALVDAAKQLEDHGSITGYSIEVRTDMPEVADWSSFENWREAKYSEHGTHFWLTGSYGEGLANPGSPWTNAWTDPKDAKIHTVTADYHDFKEELSIQECLHPHLFEPDVDDWISVDEHELGGTQYTRGSWRVTPMATSYEDSYLNDGDCRDYYGWTGYTTELSYCTKEAVKACNPET
jgi:hypothetical protein